VRAEDPDFALRRVTLRAVRDGRSLSIAPLLEKKSPKKPWPGAFLGSYTFEPVKLGLKAGDRVEYWAEAEDNREPDANRSATDKRSIIVVGPENNPPPQDDQDKQDKPGAAKDNHPQNAQKKNANDGDKSTEDKAASDDKRNESTDKSDNKNNDPNNAKKARSPMARKTAPIHVNSPINPPTGPPSEPIRPPIRAAP